MNIKIPDSWVKDYIETNATPNDIAKALSLHAFSVEKIIPCIDGDSVYEIEVTPNRGDVLSVVGLARELMAILPSLGFSCIWKIQPVYQLKSADSNSLDVVLTDPEMVPRFSAIILDNATPTQSSPLICSRLEKVGIRPFDNIVDITNYLMIDKGQPMHSFDYDKIKNHKMIVRESKQGEIIVTLDGMSRVLPDGVIVIEDGAGQLIDLCGIMGAKNSEIDKNTKRILLFVQVYDPLRIRRASMSLGHRTDAALRFEKGIDYEGVIPSLNQAVDMINQSSHSHEASKLIDIVHKTYPPKKVSIDYDRINLIAGLTINHDQVDDSLTKLGFVIKDNQAEIPSWRYDDININEDLAEEVIRLYGYYNIKGILPIGQISSHLTDSTLKNEDKIKDFLKYQGFFECYTKSASNVNLVGKDTLKLKNPLSEDFFALRSSLVPQLIDVSKRNQNYAETIMLFEMASVYLPVSRDLANQPTYLALVTKNISYQKLKGIVEALFFEFGISKPINITVHPESVLSFEINLQDLLPKAKKVKSYTPITRFNSIKEDLTLIIDSNVTFPQILDTICSTDKMVSKVVYKGLYKNNLTLSIEFLNPQKQITSNDTKKIKGAVLNNLSKIGIFMKKTD